MVLDWRIISGVLQDEHAEYVRAMATLAAFMAGFVNVAFIQFDFDPAQVPYSVLLGFAVSNALTVSFFPGLSSLKGAKLQQPQCES